MTTASALPSTIGAAPADARGRRKGSLLWALEVLGVVCVLLAGWQLAADSIDSKILLPEPLDVVQAGWEHRADLMTAWGSSARLFLIGYFVAIALGVPIGILLGFGRKLTALDSLVDLAYVTPRIVLVPLIIAWFGIYDNAKIFLIVLMTIPEVIIFTRDGVRAVPAELRELAAINGASFGIKMRDIFLPGAAQSIFTGLRLAAGRAVIGVVAAEFFFAIFSPTDGVAAFIRLKTGQFATAPSLAALLSLIAFGVLAQAVVQVIGNRVTRNWGRSTE
jgi:NitT/TauT family transport system permease protein